MPHSESLIRISNNRPNFILPLCTDFRPYNVDRGEILAGASLRRGGQQAQFCRRFNHGERMYDISRGISGRARGVRSYEWGPGSGASSSIKSEMVTV